MKLEKPWTYRTPEKTIDFAAGEHSVFQYVKDKAVADGVIEEETDGSASKARKGNGKGDPDGGEG